MWLSGSDVMSILRKLRGITKVIAEDCDLIDALMTKYSVYEHSQSDELPLVPVELDEFEKDVLELIAWINEFKNSNRLKLKLRAASQPRGARYSLTTDLITLLSVRSRARSGTLTSCYVSLWEQVKDVHRAYASATPSRTFQGIEKWLVSMFMVINQSAQLPLRLLKTSLLERLRLSCSGRCDF